MLHDRKTFVGFCIVFIIVSLIAVYFIATSDLPIWAKFWLLK